MVRASTQNRWAEHPPQFDSFGSDGWMNVILQCVTPPQSPPLNFSCVFPLGVSGIVQNVVSSLIEKVGEVGGWGWGWWRGREWTGKTPLFYFHSTVGLFFLVKT